MIDFRRLGWLLKEAREGLGLSIYDVERITEKEFKTSQLSAYENARSQIPLAKLEKLAKVYGQDYYSLLTKMESSRNIRDITDLPPEEQVFVKSKRREK